MISIHALLAESDVRFAGAAPTPNISIHALLAESDLAAVYAAMGLAQPFLSTLSLRRATAGKHAQQPTQQDFYPRSPCGERHHVCQSSRCGWLISIHALLAESDTVNIQRPTAKNDFYPRSPCGERQFQKLHQVRHMQFLSTLSLRRATHYDNYNLHCVEISIHALLAESDGISSTLIIGFSAFLSTLSLRRAT